MKIMNLKLFLMTMIIRLMRTMIESLLYLKEKLQLTFTLTMIGIKFNF